MSAPVLVEDLERLLESYPMPKDHKSMLVMAINLSPQAWFDLYLADDASYFMTDFLLDSGRALNVENGLWRDPTDEEKMHGKSTNEKLDI